VLFEIYESKFQNLKTKDLSVHESPYLRLQRVMNLKILNGLRN